MTFTILMILAGLVLCGILIAKADKYDRGSATIVLAIIFVVLWLPLSFLPVYFIGFHYETSRGEHTGYVVAVERTGVFFKTGTAYVKTDATASNEDKYCFIDKDLEAQLQEYSVKKIHANIYFFDWFSAGIANCSNEEGGIIYKIEPLTN